MLQKRVLDHIEGVNFKAYGNAAAQWCFTVGSYIWNLSANERVFDVQPLIL